MKTRRKSNPWAGYEQLLADYGYRLEGKVLIQKAIAYLPAQIMGFNFRNALDAAEWLCPIIREDAYSSRLVELQRKAMAA